MKLNILICKHNFDFTEQYLAIRALFFQPLKFIKKTIQFKNLNCKQILHWCLKHTDPKIEMYIEFVSNLTSFYGLTDRKFCYSQEN